MLSSIVRRLSYLTALLYAIVGAALFILPGQMAPVFAWNVTPFMAMTIGAWCLGNTWLAWISARRGEWRLVYSALFYLGLFGTLQVGVVVAFADKLRLAHPIAWVYLAALAVNVIAFLAGAGEWLRNRPAGTASGPSPTKAHRIELAAFTLFVGGLGIYALVEQSGGLGTNGGIFPELMSLFTLRSFGAFYLALSLGMLPLFADRSMATWMHHGFASSGFLVTILSATFVNIGLFDFAESSGGLLYIGVYLFVGVTLLFILIKGGTGKRATT